MKKGLILGGVAILGLITVWGTVRLLGKKEVGGTTDGGEVDLFSEAETEFPDSLVFESGELIENFVNVLTTDLSDCRKLLDQIANYLDPDDQEVIKRVTLEISSQIETLPERERDAIQTLLMPTIAAIVLKGSEDTVSESMFFSMIMEYLPRYSELPAYRLANESQKAILEELGAYLALLNVAGIRMESSASQGTVAEVQ